MSRVRQQASRRANAALQRTSPGSRVARRNSATGVAEHDLRGLGRRRGQPRPANLASQAERVDHRRVVTVDARGQDGALPAVRRQLESVQLLEDRPKAVDAAQPMLRVHVLPREQEPHEVRRADRLDFRPQPVQRVAMNARQQPPVAPLNPPRQRPPSPLATPPSKILLCVSPGRRCSGIRTPPENDSLGFESQQRRVGVGLVDRQRIRRATSLSSARG